MYRLRVTVILVALLYIVLKLAGFISSHDPLDRIADLPAHIVKDQCLTSLAAGLGFRDWGTLFPNWHLDNEGGRLIEGPWGCTDLECTQPRCSRDYTFDDLAPTFLSECTQWTVYGRQMPWWSVFTSYPQTATISDEEKKRFYESGSGEVAKAIKIFRESGMTDDQINVGNILDFGCKLGRASASFAKHFQHVVCLDQSYTHLQTALTELDRLRDGDLDDDTWTDMTSNIHFIQSGLNLMHSVGGRRFRAVYSNLVFQHMIPPMQMAYMEQLCDLLVEGGLALFQIPTFIREGEVGHKSYDCNNEFFEYWGGMQMHYTPQAKIEAHMKSRGCSVVMVDGSDDSIGIPLPDGQSHRFVFKKQAGPTPNVRFAAGHPDAE